MHHCVSLERSANLPDYGCESDDEGTRRKSGRLPWFGNFPWNQAIC